MAIGKHGMSMNYRTLFSEGYLVFSKSTSCTLHFKTTKSLLMVSSQCGMQLFQLMSRLRGGERADNAAACEVPCHNFLCPRHHRKGNHFRNFILISIQLFDYIEMC